MVNSSDIKIHSITNLKLRSFIMRTRDKKSFPQHEGTILQYKYSRRKKGKIFYVKVAGMDYNIGYTLVDADDPTDIRTCFNGPLSPNIDDRDSKDEYDIAFGYLLECLREKKIYDVDYRRNLQGMFFSGGSMSSCAFGV